MAILVNGCHGSRGFGSGLPLSVGRHLVHVVQRDHILVVLSDSFSQISGQSSSKKLHLEELQHVVNGIIFPLGGSSLQIAHASRSILSWGLDLVFVRRVTLLDDHHCVCNPCQKFSSCLLEAHSQVREAVNNQFVICLCRKLFLESWLKVCPCKLIR